MILNSFALSAIAVLFLASNTIANHWPTPQPTPILKCCIKDCFGRPDGDYQSCHGCQYYATCAGGNIFNPNPTISFWDRRPCPAGTYWDDISKQCVSHMSRTCTPHQWDICGNPECESMLPPDPCPCEIKDYVFVLDGSISISDAHFADSKTWLIDIVNNHLHSQSNIAAIQFSSSWHWIHEFSDVQQPRDTITASIAAENQINGGTSIYNPLNAAITAVSAQPNERVIILLTDGEASSVCSLEPALSAADIHLVVIGLDNTDPNMACLNPTNTIIINNFDFDALTTELEDCDAICQD